MRPARELLHQYQETSRHVKEHATLPKKEKQDHSEGQKKVFADGCGFYKLFWVFVLGSFYGDIVETVFVRITAGEWMSRSSLVMGQFSLV